MAKVSASQSIGRLFVAQSRRRICLCISSEFGNYCARRKCEHCFHKAKIASGGGTLKRAILSYLFSFVYLAVVLHAYIHLVSDDIFHQHPRGRELKSRVELQSEPLSATPRQTVLGVNHEVVTELVVVFHCCSSPVYLQKQETKHNHVSSKLNTDTDTAWYIMANTKRHNGKNLTTQLKT